jgi:hypothetical protein
VFSTLHKKHFQEESIFEANTFIKDLEALSVARAHNNAE